MIKFNENKSLWVAIILVGVMSIGLLVNAYSGTSGTVFEGDCVNCILGGQSEQLEGMLGASGSRFPNGISANSTSPSAGEVRGTTLAITSTSAFTGDADFSAGVGVSTTTSPYEFSVETPTSTIMSTEPATSTILFVGSYTASKGGQIMLEDTDGAGCTAITALNGVLTAYTPTVCPTQ